MEKKIISLHLIADHDFVHHTVSVICPCKPEQIEKGIWKHQPFVKYRTYKLYDDGKFDVVTANETVLV